ncbi:MAG: aminotransferase class I/II-fold pyridoxal phosphate-dependent enzyme [Faecalicatena sp.]|uniref:pyridoxal phosphate-dependent aminotransferase n=1 Tax=Faecalicatena sp. TaxID=2005360 RepID=UPI00258BB4CA|nr:threonine-phosphate decarboxylase [Faecalicatena sp.]MCI6465996.1 aminotransferase class I/II-fold pyridoxal phosphate-dependent enzyme [Faecalicatena sp.]MDY5616917.1 threonine-phosphate decarboxylase [Lachnospiraceae bacterium]
MSTKPEFHGSDLEKIEEYYGIPKESIISFGANVNPLGLSQNVKEDIRQNLDIISSYPDREYQSLRRAIGDYCSVSPYHVLVGNGSTELISLLIGQRCPKKTLILGPTYSEYARELSFSDSTQEYYHLTPDNGFSLVLADFLKKLKEGFDLLIICNPNNPTSSVIKTDDMRQILAACLDTNTFVMIDETYVEFAPDISEVTAMSFVQEFDNFMVLRGISKFFAAPGLRLGYGVTSNQAFLERVKEHQIPWSLNSIGAFAGERMLRDHEYISKTRDLILSERDRMQKELKKLKNITVFDAYANFILIQLHKDGITAPDVFEACIRQGLMIRDCSSFQCLEGEYVRFCVMMPEDNTRLLHILKELLG